MKNLKTDSYDVITNELYYTEHKQSNGILSEVFYSTMPNDLSFFYSAQFFHVKISRLSLPGTLDGRLKFHF